MCPERYMLWNDTAARRAATSTVEPRSPTFAVRSSTSFFELSTWLAGLPTLPWPAVHIERFVDDRIERSFYFASQRELRQGTRGAREPQLDGATTWVAA